MEDIQRWDEAILKWQQGKYRRQDAPKVKNPYQEPNSGETFYCHVLLFRRLTVLGLQLSRCLQ